jgi:hypothetical protein
MASTKIISASETRFINQCRYLRNTAQIFISIVNALKVVRDPILHEHYLQCMLPYSKFCKDGLMMVKLSKHIVIKEKIKIYIVVLTGNKIHFAVS